MTAEAASSSALVAMGDGVHRMPPNNGIGPGIVDALPTASLHWVGNSLTLSTDWTTHLCQSDGVGGYEWIQIGSGGGGGTPGPSPGLVMLSSDTFSGVTSFSLAANTFTNDYDTYLIIISNLSTATSGADVYMRLRAAGVDASGASDYAWVAEGLTDNTDAQWLVWNNASAGTIAHGVITATIVRPKNATPTAIQWHSGGEYSTAAPYDETGSGTHGLSTAYDSLTILTSAGNIAGTVRVYAYENTPGTSTMGPEGPPGAPGDDGLITAIADTASVDLIETTGTLTAVVLPAGVDHNSLANLATGDPHTQYALDTDLTAGLATKQPLDADLTTLSANITGAGHALVDDASAADQRTTLGLVAGGAGDIWVEKGGDTMTGDLTLPASAYGAGWNGSQAAATRDAVYDELEAHKAAADPHPGYLTPAEGNAAYQPLDTDLTALAGIAGVEGDIIYRNATQWTRLPKGSAGQVLKINAGATAPEWGTDLTGGAGASPVTHVFSLGADGSAIGPAIADYYGATSAASLDANSVYFIEFYTNFLKTTNGTIIWTVLFSSAPTKWYAIFDQDIGSPPATLLAANRLWAHLYEQTGASGASPASGSITTATNHNHITRVWVRTNAACNVRLRATESAGTITPRASSFYTVRKMTNTGSFVA